MIRAVSLVSKVLIFSVMFSELLVMAQNNEKPNRLIEVYRSNEIITGVTTTQDGRIFLEYPHLDGSSGLRVAELQTDGSTRAYPDLSWNSWTPGDDPTRAFVRTNSIRIGPDGKLWVVDTGTPKFGAKVLRGGVKLVAIDTKTNRVARVYPLDGATSEGSFVDDVRFNGHHAYLTDAGMPAIIVLDLNTGATRRILGRDQSTTAQRPVIASGKVLHTVDGNEVRIHADQLEVSPNGEYLYYQALTGPMYRIETRYVDDPSLSPTEVAGYRSLWVETPSTGGTAIDSSGTIYLSDVEKRRILKIAPDATVNVLIEDEKLDWPDAMWIDQEGYLWLPIAQLDKIAPFQRRTSHVHLLLVIYKLHITGTPR